MTSPEPQPQDLKRRYWAAVVGSAAGVVAITLWSYKLLGPESFYGYGVFLGLPLLQGLICSFVLEAREPVDFGRHLSADGWAILLGIAALLVLVNEGIICVLMAFPLVFAISLVGSGLAHWVMGMAHRQRNVAKVSLLALVPCFLVADSLTGGQPAVRSLSTELVINASPEQIWPYLSNLDSVATDYWLFDAGVAHPLEIRTRQARVGGARECVLSTGVMNETISEFVPNRRLVFRMLNTPPSMKELNPFGEVRAPHLVGHYESLEGSFDLIPLANGKTLLRGTSIFQHKFRPVTYWNWWTDLIVRKVQVSVLEEIKRRAEK